MERVCQFYLRGRCNRSNCEFKHERKNTGIRSRRAGQACRFYASSGNCRFGSNCRFSHDGAAKDLPPPSSSSSKNQEEDSDEEEERLALGLRFGRDSDEESSVSGFTDLPSMSLKESKEAEEDSKKKTEISPPVDRGKSLADLRNEWSDDGEAEGTQGDDERDEDEDRSHEDKETDSNDKNEASKDPIFQSETPQEPSVPSNGADDTQMQISEWPLEEPQEEEEESANSEKPKEEWVTLIFGEDGKPSGETSKSNVYDLNPADTEMEKEREWPLRRRGGAKVRGGLRGGVKSEGVTKIGNNMYFYTGKDDPKYLKSSGAESMDSDSQLEELSSEWINSVEDSNQGGTAPPAAATTKPKRRTKKHKAHRTDYVYAGKSTAAKTRRCGECENCNKEDCNKCDACRDKPRNGGKGLKKQACIYRVCLWKNPSGKINHVPGGRPRGRPKTKTTPPGLIKAADALKESEDKDDDKKKGGRLSLPVIAPGTTSNSKKPTPNDSDLPEFDPDKFKPGYTPSVVKKGDSEYVVVVTGIKDTGLCGKYWSNVENLPSRRRSKHTDEVEAAKNDESGADGKKKTLGSKAKDEGKKSVRNSTAKRKLRGDSKKNNANDEESTPMEEDTPSKKSRYVPSVEENSLFLRDSSGVNNNSGSDESSSKKPSAIRSVSCVADTSTQREVVVECFAPYDDHKWVNIGKERDNMMPDSVQYARALRPPYHLLSFLRIKGNSTKGMSCTDKNTMVFVVLEGEISVVLHTTQFNAKKGDSFYIPPKNYYNLINQKVREAELSLIQFQYDGPLPTIAASSQSGSAKGPI